MSADDPYGLNRRRADAGALWQTFADLQAVRDAMTTRDHAVDQLVQVFLDATDDLPDDAARGIATLIYKHPDLVRAALGVSPETP